MGSPIDGALITSVNCWDSRYGNAVKYIVIHYTANTGTDATARGNCEYFQNEYRGASAHIFVDEYSTWQSVPLEFTAWHCGAEGRDSLFNLPYSKWNGAENVNSIGVEMVSHTDKDGNYYIPSATIKRAAGVVRWLLEIYPGAVVCRHYDVTGKKCPAPMVDDPELWREFLALVKNEREEEPMTASEKASFDKLVSRVEELEEQAKIKWAYIDSNLPSWAKPTIKKMVKKGYLKGNDQNSLELSRVLMRIFVIMDRAGVFD